MTSCSIEPVNKLITPIAVAALFLMICLAQIGAAEASPEAPADPFLWLEDVTGDKPLSWVKEQNAVSQRELEGSPNFEPIRQRLLSIMDSKERIPYVAKHGAYYYNFWRDEKNPRGLWRRT